MPEVKRAVRVANEVRAELVTLLQREVSDERLRTVMITDVKLTDDLRNAKVYYRLFGEPSDADKKAAEKALVGAGGFLRREVTQSLRMKYAPELRFFFDDRMDEALRVDQLLYEVAQDDKKRKR